MTIFHFSRCLPLRVGGRSDRIPNLKSSTESRSAFCFLINDTLLYMSVKQIGIQKPFYYTYVNIGAIWSTGGLIMSIGTRIIQLRNKEGLTQQELSDRTGLAASYLSRIENRHLEPRPNTLRKIASALGVPVSEIFQERPAQLGTLQCVITSSGNCIMNLLHSSHGKHVQSNQECYNPRQLQLLRMANYLIQTADKRLLDSLEVLLSALLSVEQKNASMLGRVPPPVTGEDVGSGHEG